MLYYLECEGCFLSKLIELLEKSESVYYVVLNPANNKVEYASESLLRFSECPDYKNKELKEVIGCLAERTCPNSAVKVDMVDTDKVIHMLECNALNKELFVIKTKIYSDGSEKHLMIFTDTGDYTSNTRIVKELDNIFSHEIRNALSNLNLVNQNFADSLEYDDYSDFQLNLKVSIQTAQVMEKILNTYENLKKNLLSDSYKVKKAISLYELIQEVASDQSALARNKNATVKINSFITGNTPGIYNVRHNKGLIYLLFSNLLNNALKYCTESTDVSINIDKLEEYYLVSVENHGIMDDHIRDNFFSRYIRGNNSNGTGYGTYCSKILTELFHGDIKMEYINNIVKISVKIPS